MLFVVTSALDEVSSCVPESVAKATDDGFTLIDAAYGPVPFTPPVISISTRRMPIGVCMTSRR